VALTMVSSMCTAQSLQESYFKVNSHWLSTCELPMVSNWHKALEGVYNKMQAGWVCSC